MQKNLRQRPQTTTPTTHPSPPAPSQSLTLTTTTTHTCTTCSKPDTGLSLPFLTCTRCATRTYCSHECQESDWPSHKPACAPRSSSILDTMSAVERAFFRSLLPPDFLHRCPEQTVYEMLDDAYDLRVVDCAKLADEGTTALLPEGQEGGWRAFVRFLDLAEGRVGLLPAWWGVEKRALCEGVAARAAGLGRDAPKVNGHWVMRRYRDFLMPMRLRLLAESVYGTKVPVAW